METKLCTKCNTVKDCTEFRFRNKAKNTFSPWCKKCFSEYERNQWRSSKERRDSNKSHNKIRKIRNHQYVWDYLLSHPCEKCGETNPIVLQFHHSDRDDKTIEVSVLSRGSGSIAVIDAEVKKCEVLCANCHLIVTANQMGWYKHIVHKS